ncbi:hypothetical protein YC2023_049351 [Brassica napus]
MKLHHVELRHGPPPLRRQRRDQIFPGHPRRTGLIGESSQTYVSRTGFRRRSGAICGGGIEIQASHPIDFALLPPVSLRSLSLFTFSQDEELKKEKQKVEEEEQEEKDYGVT